MSFRYRIDYSKLEGMRYTSNLDIHKMWERTFRRAKLPLLYSQGFHPQPKIQQASPLPLGFLSNNELVDFLLEHEMDPDKLALDLSSALPKGIGINSIQVIDSGNPALQTQTESSEYYVYLLDHIDTAEITRNIEELLAKNSISRNRRGKTYDLRPLIIALEYNHEEPIFIKMVLKSKDGATGRPDEVLSELNLPLESTKIIRNKIFLTEPSFP
jgi:radical SAM-linked protein